MRVSNYRRDPKVYILLNISGKCGFQNAAGPQNYDYAHLPVEYGLCRTKMFAVSLLLETIFVLCIRRRYSRVRLVLVCIRGFGSLRLLTLFSLLLSSLFVTLFSCCLLPHWLGGIFSGAPCPVFFARYSMIFACPPYNFLNYIVNYTLFV